MLQVSVNYHGNPSCNEHQYQPYMKHQQTTLEILCDECTYQPYMECQQTALVIVNMMNTNHKAFVSYHLTLIHMSTFVNT